MSTETSYDTVAYPAHAYEYTHPDRLATIAALYGMQPAPLSRCRVLELGAGTGANLLPMAYQWPESEFVAIDLSSSAVAEGQAAVAAMGLDNIDVRQCNILDIGDELGRFDYIIAHGVYSWVPAVVREGMLALIGECLTPHGVAYVSYNSQPGSYLRNLTREIMHYHVRGVDDPRQRIEQGRAILKTVSELSAADEVYGRVLRGEYERVAKMHDAVLFHDDLSDENTAFTLSEVVAAAERHGLQYLSDATFHRADLQRLPEPARKLLEQFPESEFVAREQYQDFIEGHSFRRSLLCRDDVVLHRKLKQDCVRRFHLAAEAIPAETPVDFRADGVTSFKIGREGGLSTGHRLSKAAMVLLGECWPATMRFPDLVAAAFDLLRKSGAAIAEDREDDVDTLTNVLFRASCAGHVSLHLFPPRLTIKISERPRASRVARKQAETGSLITSLTHGTVSLDDVMVRRFLGLVDGTRTVDALVADLSASVGGAAAGAEAPKVTREAVEQNLRLLARLALLEA
jgi:methyltransferase-like protein/trans-aconitate methyltransferase